MTEYEMKKIQLERLIEAWEYLTPEQVKAHTDMIVGTAGVNRMIAMRAADSRYKSDTPTGPGKKTA